MHDHILQGCRTRPLAGYLKALGILRLLSEQKDPSAKGWWEKDCFVIRTALDHKALTDFFCTEYRPTSLVSPWGGSSGFYLGDNTTAIDAIEATDDPRFSEYAAIIGTVKSWPDIPIFKTVGEVKKLLGRMMEGAGSQKRKETFQKLLKDIEKNTPLIRPDQKENPPAKGQLPLFAPGGAESPSPDALLLSDIEVRAGEKGDPDAKAWSRWWKIIRKAITQCNKIVRDERKMSILSICRTRLPESAAKWLDAVYVLQKEGEAAFNPVMGTGGNEGRLELSNNFMQRLVALFLQSPKEKAQAFFEGAAFDAVIPDLIPASIGQYDPGRAGGYNQGMGIENKVFKINPWDFILTLEGSLLLAGAAVRRNPTDDRSHLSIPFTVRYTPAGFSSDTPQEGGRAETWFPTWERPAALPEIRHLFGEGRAAVGKKPAATGVDFSRAVKTLGVDRGIKGFERYVFLERRGQGYYVAVPANRTDVAYVPQLQILEELDPIRQRISRFLRGFKNPPATFEAANHAVETAIFACCQKPDPRQFSELIAALGRMERLFAERDRSRKPALESPLTGLSPRWIELCDDGEVEVRIAGALASIGRTGAVGPLRSNLAEIDPEKPWQWSSGKGDRVWRGNSFQERLSNVLARRIMDAARRSAHHPPLYGMISVPVADIMRFLYRECEDNRIERLLWGFSLIDWKKGGAKRIRARWRGSLTRLPISRTYGLLKLLHTAHPIRDIRIRGEGRIVPLLMAGRTSEACEIAARRLRISGLPVFDVRFEPTEDPIRLAASLLIPVRNPKTLERIVLKKQNMPRKGEDIASGGIHA